MNDRIQEIKKRLAEATPGPWEAVVGNYNEIAIVGQKGLVMSFGGYAGFDNFKGTEPSDEDERLITWAPSDISYLLSEVERLQRENERLSNEMDSLMIALEDRAPYAAQKYWTYLLNEKEKLVEALEWYADEANYIRTEEDYTIGYPPEIRFDRGLKARTALSHLKG